MILNGEKNVNVDAMGELYERLISVPLGNTTQAEQIDSFLRATMVAVGNLDNHLYHRLWWEIAGAIGLPGDPPRSGDPLIPAEVKK